MKFILGQLAGLFAAHAGLSFAKGYNIAGILLMCITFLIIYFGSYCDD